MDLLHNGFGRVAFKKALERREWWHLHGFSMARYSLRFISQCSLHRSPIWCRTLQQRSSGSAKFVGRLAFPINLWFLCSDWKFIYQSPHSTYPQTYYVRRRWLDQSNVVSSICYCFEVAYRGWASEILWKVLMVIGKAQFVNAYCV